MIPFKKIFILIIRTFSHPMLNYFKRKQQQNQLKTFSWFFMGVGRRSHSWEHWLNRHVLKSTKKTQATRISDKIALEKGIQSFYEVIFYIVILGLPFYELYKGSKAAHVKENKEQERVRKLQRDVVEMNQRVAAVLELAKEVVEEGMKAEERRKKLQASTKARMEDLESTGKDGESAIQSVREKVQEMLQNAVEVVGEEFQDHLDELEGPLLGEVEGEAEGVGGSAE